MPLKEMKQHVQEDHHCLKMISSVTTRPQVYDTEKETSHLIGTSLRHCTRSRSRKATTTKKVCAFYLSVYFLTNNCLYTHIKKARVEVVNKFDSKKYS